MTCPP